MENSPFENEVRSVIKTYIIYKLAGWAGRILGPILFFIVALNNPSGGALLFVGCFAIIALLVLYIVLRLMWLVIMSLVPARRAPAATVSRRVRREPHL